MITKRDATTVLSPGRYYVDFYDAFDGWGGEFGFYLDRVFDALEEARTCRDNLNKDLPSGNKSMGEHYGIIDRQSMTEIECSA